MTRRFPTRPVAKIVPYDKMSKADESNIEVCRADTEDTSMTDTPSLTAVISLSTPPAKLSTEVPPALRPVTPLAGPSESIKATVPFKVASAIVALVGRGRPRHLLSPLRSHNRTPDNGLHHGRFR